MGVGVSDWVGFGGAGGRAGGRRRRRSKVRGNVKGGRGGIGENERFKYHRAAAVEAMQGCVPVKKKKKRKIFKLRKIRFRTTKQNNTRKIRGTFFFF